MEQLCVSSRMEAEVNYGLPIVKGYKLVEETIILHTYMHTYTWAHLSSLQGRRDTTGEGGGVH